MRAWVVVEYVRQLELRRVELYLEADSLAAAEEEVRCLIAGVRKEEVFSLRARWDQPGDFLGESLNMGDGVYRP